MAGVKITDLGILTAPVAEDLLYIVDISDTSQSPQGTSKQIELGNIVSSGLYEPLFTNISGTFSATSMEGDAFYHKSGNFVQFFFKLRIEFSSDNIAQFSITLPTPSSGNSHTSNAICSLMNAQTTGGAVIRNTNNPNIDAMEFQFETENSSSDIYEFNVIANYFIII
jgi:hypothetical protein